MIPKKVYNYNNIRVFAVCLAIAVSILWWFLALTSRTYHYQIVGFPINNYITLDISLWNVWASSDCSPNIMRNKLNIDFCKLIVSKIDRQSIGNVMRYLCLLGYGSNSRISRCSSFTDLYIASVTLIIIASMVIVLLISSLFFLTVLYITKRLQRIRSIVLTQTILAAMLSIMGIFLYLLIGGFFANIMGFGNTIKSNRMSSLFFGSSTLGVGFYIALLACLYTCLVVPWVSSVINIISKEEINKDDTDVIRQALFDIYLEEEIDETQRLLMMLNDQSRVRNY
ncbi:hypothetical protein cand_004100 [Cryptosporidium andersoni]|uniref:Uncharacterized protein n=1 Tax=Cryptosporidium andersoni TaxID=117008 RepID=A0A1J4MLS6_9CRYT|nr:hypothetical protein cand_004100 [Cryptosporidium andersoni]